MITAPLHQRLQGLRAALANGEPLDPLGAQLDPDTEIVTIQTHRGPASFHRRDLAQVAQGAAERAAERKAPAPPKLATVHHRPAERPRPAAPAQLAPEKRPRTAEPAPVHQVAQLAPVKRTSTAPAAPAAKAKPSTRAKWFPLEQTWAYMDQWTKAEKPGTAGKHAIGNFTTVEDRERTLQALAHNIAQARASGHEPLIKVAERAMATALAIKARQVEAAGKGR